jgi:site-specific DNA-methyltransferase (adenine-specific)/site-specific DNA-methyltransferase (cytosine-N4-specific)
MLAFALRNDGWFLRSEIIWNKPNPMPESVKDRPTKSHEQIFLFAKSEKYYYDAEAVAEPSSSNIHPVYETRNRRSVWSLNTGCYEGHFATFPPELPELCMKAGCPAGGTVLDCFAGSGTTLLVAAQNGRNYVGIDLNPEYIEITRKRLKALAQQKA